MGYTLVIVALTTCISKAVQNNVMVDSMSYRPMGTYVERQNIWADPEDTFIRFFQTNGARKYNRGDVYLNVTDASHEGEIFFPDLLAKFIVNFRMLSDNSARLYLFFSGGNGDDEKWAPAFVRVFKEFIYDYGTPKMGRLGISFNVDLHDHNTWNRIFDAADTLKANSWMDPFDLAIDVLINFNNRDAQLVDEVMYRADHVTVRGIGNYDSYLDHSIMVFFLASCPNCTKDNYSNYKAKITYMAVGNCHDPPSCSQTSMCAYYSNRSDDPKGGILYAYNQLTGAIDYIESYKYPFAHFFEAGGTHIMLDSFDWVMCFYGSETWDMLGLTRCVSEYRLASQKCRAQG
ncbi:hypothetical protein Pmar_PMAR007343 [Perkinsus marinus ATCC 50983]|uniref:Chitinase n=1 Tax=Perkinsus marinus (strain ATCC 50983 / TXsc) TaxID=423536 RepID=C5K632_PERM5|nr:hypothetical protein Pmar_PMAR007343 [Perkinsus marinus ATCC 50983]EER20062.1 hypothetical protein Pmar_PMAR007343 [Perkinsus marinus ATCC 50983]|eukprot:XP_002788266.1 hypothetical protein Pmar_PMAR007343 [Perkinsus marinus ATCC 50983]